MMTRKLVEVVVVVVAHMCNRSSGGVPVVQSQNNFRYLSSCGAGLAAHRAGCMTSNLGPEVGSWSSAFFNGGYGRDRFDQIIERPLNCEMR